MKPFKFPAPKSPRDDASLMPSIEGKRILMGFWHNWPSEPGNGYQFGQSTNMPLEAVPKEYNVVAVAFMKGHGIPTFSPAGYSDAEFRRQVGVLNKEGRAVLISLGGADAEIVLYAGQEHALANEIIRLVESYGFDGLDIDLEQAAITAGDNRTVIPLALKLVREHYEKSGLHFIISMAPEFPYLNLGREYAPYIVGLEGVYDFIAPQYYNQGGDGVSVPELDPSWLGQNDDARKEDFLYYLTHSIVTGSRGFIHIPPQKFVIGLPANTNAAATGFVISPQDTYNAFKRLDDEGLSIKGLMTWSVDWDAGKDKHGVDYNWGFLTSYKSLIHGGGGVPGPSAPRQLHALEVTKTSIALSWLQPGTGGADLNYELFRATERITRTTALSFVDEGLQEGTLYSYTVVAVDAEGRRSSASNRLDQRTEGEIIVPPEPEYPAWSPNSHSYEVGDGVEYENKQYICLQKHTSNAGWSPVVAITLWRLRSL
ncbi:glycosyl hydrolase family 18 protein [Pseudomonas sp.]|uniref:carbohydrate-binding protein n=1 Tax=Pseudomonas sp. TaxID=306 RepID=UPI002628491D|nr:glycosyl hydrolase family 18 protein [Pseudomonas sp.]